MVSGSPDVSNLFPLIARHLSPIVTDGVWLYACFQFICLPLQQFICLPVWLVVCGSTYVSNSFSPYSNSFVSQSGWWCPALRMSPIHLSRLVAIHLSPSLACGVRLSGCLQFICLPLKQFICLPVWLVVSGSLDVSNSFVSPYSNSFVSESGWWCPALHLSPLLAINLSPSLAGGVRLSGCRLPVAAKVSQLLPSLLHLLSSLPPVSQMWSPSCLLDVSQVRLPRCCLPVASRVSTLVGELSSCRQDVVSQLSPTCGFPGVVSQLFPMLLHMLSSLPPVSQMWSPSCLPDVVPSFCFPVRLLFSCL